MKKNKNYNKVDFKGFIYNIKKGVFYFTFESKYLWENVLARDTWSGTRPITAAVTIHLSGRSREAKWLLRPFILVFRQFLLRARFEKRQETLPNPNHPSELHVPPPADTLRIRWNIAETPNVPWRLLRGSDVNFSAPFFEQKKLLFRFGQTKKLVWGQLIRLN